MMLVGYTGLVSLGHAAFLAIGAYTHAVLLGYGVPFVISVPIAVAFTALIGALVGIPALRMTGVYLAVATLAFERIVAYVIEHWEPVTGGLRGMAVTQPTFFGVSIADSHFFYYLCLGILALGLLGARNLLRSPTGRAFVAVRDSEISAESMGVHLARTKTAAFAVSAGFTGLGGALFAHKAGYLAPDAFTVQTSIQLLLLVVVGGLGSLHGVVFGAIFVGFLPQVIALARDYLPGVVNQIPGLELGVFGAILVLFLVFEPLGIYGRWLKIRSWFTEFPLYRKATHRRQKSYLRTERVH
jgi:branched-chain amino acid transport system permease protein